MLARNVVLGVGTAPKFPAPLASLTGSSVLHSADYLPARDRLLDADDVTVVGSGQSGAEVFLDLLRSRPSDRGHLRWLTRTAAFAPMEYSKLGLEQFTPDYARFFHGLDEPTRDRLVPSQWQLYKAISAETIGEIYDELYRRTVDGGWPRVVALPGRRGHDRDAARCSGRVGTAARAAGRCGERDHRCRGVRHRVPASATSVTCSVRWPTGSTATRPDDWRSTADYRVRADLPGALFVQNAERHTHGVGAPDLGLVAWRAATILNAVCGRAVYPLPDRTAFTTFGLPGGGG